MRILTYLDPVCGTMYVHILNEGLIVIQAK